MLDHHDAPSALLLEHEDMQILGASVGAVLAGSAMGVSFLLAQAPVLDGWMPLVGQVTTGGVLVWYLWYTTTVTFPKISDDHLKRIEEIAAKHDATIDKLVASQDAAINRLMDRFDRWVEKLSHPGESMFAPAPRTPPKPPNLDA